MFNTPILVSLVTPAGSGQLLPGRSPELLKVWLDPGSGVVGLVGELDSSNSARLEAALEGRIGPHRIVRRLIALTKLDEHPHISIQDGAAGPSGGFAERRGIVRLT